MTDITCDIQEGLDARVSIQNGELYITDGHGWVVCFYSPSSVAPPAVEEVLRSMEGQGVDWRILTASAVDLESMSFLPAMGRSYVKIEGVPPMDLAGFVERSRESGRPPNVSLTDLLGTRSARPRYSIEVSSGRAFAKEENVSAYVFRFGSRVLALPGDQVRALRAMGFSLMARDEDLPLNTYPVVTLVHDEAVGYMTPLSSSGVDETDDGVPLLVDAREASWIGEGDAVAVLTQESSYAPGKSLEEVLETSRTLRPAVSALLWRGWETDEIVREYESYRAVAYVGIAKGLDTTLRDAISVMEDPDTPAWKAASAAISVETACSAVEEISKLIDVDVRLLGRAVRLASIEKERADAI